MQKTKFIYKTKFLSNKLSLFPMGCNKPGLNEQTAWS
jgi:hypothetical protein